MTDRLGAIVVGTAFGGRVHVPALRAAGFDVLGVVGRDPERTARRAAEVGVEGAFTSLEEALAVPGVDVVTVSTPPDSHLDPVLAAVGAGKHVLCEKPFALSGADGRRMLEAAEAAGVVHVAGFEFRWAPREATIWRAVGEGRIGEPRLGVCQQLGPLVADGLHPSFNPDWWFDPARGGGILNAAGTHYIDRFRLWLGEIEAVSAHVLALADRPAGQQADDTYVLRLRHASGAVSAYEHCVVDRAPSVHTVRVVGSAGSVSLERDGATLATAEGVVVLDTPADLAVPAAPRLSEDPREAFTFMELPPYTKLAERFADAIRGVAADPALPPLPTFADALSVQEVVDAARASSVQGGDWITLGR